MNVAANYYAINRLRRQIGTATSVSSKKAYHILQSLSQIYESPTGIANQTPPDDNKYSREEELVAAKSGQTKQLNRQIKGEGKMDEFIAGDANGRNAAERDHLRRSGDEIGFEMSSKAEKRARHALGGGGAASSSGSNAFPGRSSYGGSSGSNAPSAPPRNNRLWADMDDDDDDFNTTDWKWTEDDYFEAPKANKMPVDCIIEHDATLPSGAVPKAADVANTMMLLRERHPTWAFHFSIVASYSCVGFNSIKKVISYLVANGVLGRIDNSEVVQTPQGPVNNTFPYFYYVDQDKSVPDTCIADMPVEARWDHALIHGRGERDKAAAPVVNYKGDLNNKLKHREVLVEQLAVLDEEIAALKTKQSLKESAAPPKFDPDKRFDTKINFEALKELSLEKTNLLLPQLGHHKKAIPSCLSLRLTRRCRLLLRHHLLHCLCMRALQ